jgi:hypothetical protein
MPISFGSVGDIIAVIQIAAQLSKALKTSGGSAEEFRDVIQELETFRKVLEQARSFYFNRSMLFF